MNQGLMTYPGISAILGGNFTLLHGVSPSVAVIQISPQGNFVSQNGTLSISFGGVVLNFPDCRVASHSLQVSSAGQVIGLTIEDRRHRWRYGEISGTYNPEDYTVTQTIDPARVKNARDLAIMCLQAMGETAFDVSFIPDTLFPRVEWDRTNPAQALDEICNLCGCRVVLRLDNSVLIARSGIGLGLPELAAMSDSLGVQSSGMPAAVKVVGGKNRYQIAFLLEAVGLDKDNGVKKLADLSYVTGATFSTVDPFSFGALSTDSEAQKLAQQTVWRWYRIKVPDEGIILPDYEKPITKLELILPLLNHQLWYYENPAGGPPKPWDPTVSGVYMDRNGSWENTPATAFTDYKRPFSVDVERGIVMFSDQVYKVTRTSTSTTYAEAVLYLDIACNVKDSVTLAPIRAEKRLPIPGGSGLDKVVIREDILFQSLTEYNADGSVKEIHNTLAAITPAMDEYLAFEVAQLQSPVTQEAHYPGILPVNLDGALQQVTWEVGKGGATTSVSRNSEFTATRLPTYEQRQRNNELRQIDTRNQRLRQATAIRDIESNRRHQSG